MYPALLMAGPPHRGKSVLSSALYQQLLRQRRAAYLFKATPDGEGQWFLEADEDEAMRQRDKRPWDAAFIAFVSAVIARRPLPLMVDAGGRPTTEQEQAIFARCTHAITVTGDAQERAAWRALCERVAVQVVAEVESQQVGLPLVQEGGDPLRVRLTGLERWSKELLDNTAGEALVERVGALFDLTAEQAWHHHRTTAEASCHAVNLDEWLWARARSDRWETAHLAPLLASLPLSESLALYGGRPNWVIAALAAHSDHPLRLFDAQFGWLTEPTLTVTLEDGAWVVTYPTSSDAHLKVVLTSSLVWPDDTLHGPLPDAPRTGRLVLDGRLPRWLLAAFVRHYAPQVEALALYEPRGRPIEIKGPTVGQRW